jgi:hypothetical protein
VFLNSTTTFYIGFDQNTTQPINIGVDMNTDSQDYLYYNTSGSWLHPPFSGSLMIRPILGSASEVVGIDPADHPKAEFMIYPNPVKSMLNVRSSVNGLFSYQILDISGRILVNGQITDESSVDISELSDGVYFIRLMNKKHSSTLKFIKTKN